MSLTRVQDPAELLAAVDSGRRVVVGFFAASSAASRQAEPEFERFCSEHESLPTYLVDLEQVRGVAPRFGVESVPTVLEVDGLRILQRLAGTQTAAFYSAALGRGAGRRSQAASGRAPHRVVVYTTRSCAYCVKAKSHLRQHGVAFTEVDVGADPRAAERMVARSGQQGVPQLEIDGQVVVGFDRGRIDALLGLAGPAASP